MQQTISQAPRRTSSYESSHVQERVSEAEWQTRVDLAACYRLIALYGWDDLIFTHISARVPGEHSFLINPYGLLFEEITASSLVKVDQQGKKLLPSANDINPAGFVIHSAIHDGREDVVCVLHTHTIAGVAVSAQKRGLLAISQNSLFPHTSLAYHDYEGLALNMDEKARLVADLADKSFLILRNHGLLTVARNIADAFLRMYILQRACEVQIAALAGGVELINIPQTILDGTQDQVRQVMRGKDGQGAAGGALAWPALLRKLDRVMPGYAD
jgi:ribulose-5-phosphate 4-epimerase/fuculose-1-phosphate aldolase